MNSRLRQRPPKQRLAQRSGSAMWPIGSRGGIEDAHAVEIRLAHAPAAPEIAVDIDAEAVGRAGTGVDEHPAGAERAAIDVEHAQLARRHGAGFHHVELRFIRRERQPVGTLHIVGHHGDRAGLAIDAIDVGRQFRLVLLALVIAEQAERRIGEPDRAVRLHHDVVRRVQLLALIAVGQHGDRAVILGADHAPAAMLAGDQAALTVARVAVGVVGGLAEDADRAGLFFPLQDAVVGNVAPQHVAAVAEIHRPFRPAAPGGKALHRGERQAIAVEARHRSPARLDRDSAGSVPTWSCFPSLYVLAIAGRRVADAAQAGSRVQASACGSR